MKPILVPTLITAALVAGCANHSATSLQSQIPRTLRHGVHVPPDATELKFNEFFGSPIGPHGLALTDKLADLDGKRVRIAGYMVEQDGGLPGKFLFCAAPLQLHDHDSALADDLPPALMHVTVPTCVGREVPYAPGLMLLTGILSIGPREETDGRMSLVRLDLDPPQSFIKSPHH